MECQKSNHIMPWNIQRLQPLFKSSTRWNLEFHQDDIDFGGDGERLCDDVCVGDNIAFLCNDGGDEEFWLLLVDEAVHTLEANIVDG